MFLSKKIKAGALQIVLVIAILILILLFSFISLISLQQKIKLKNGNYKESIYVNNQVFESLKTKSFPYGKTDSIQLSPLQTATSTLIKKQWGVFELVTVETKKKKETYQQTALIGYSKPTRETVYLRDNNQQLIVVGNTSIIGNVSIPSRGVNGGNISGTSYSKEKYIYGSISQSNTEIPKVSNKEKIISFLKGYKNEDNITDIEIEESSTKQQSFTKKTVVHRSNGVIDLVNTSLSGNIIIESNTVIKVHASSKLNDVILIAPIIEIQSGFKGRLQAFATKKILVKENTTLNYPSTLMLFDDTEQTDSQIHISNASTIKGIVAYFTDSKKQHFKPQVIIEDTSVIHGEVYCLGNFELKGTVFGSVYTNSFIVHKSGGIYMNHILNGTINSKKLPKQYVGLSFEKSYQNVAKWIN
jgi:hypothetical protein